MKLWGGKARKWRKYGTGRKENTGGHCQTGGAFYPNVMLEAAGIPPDSDLIVEILPGVLLIGAEQPLWQANRPYLKLFDDLGIEPEEVTAILEKGGYFDE